MPENPLLPHRRLKALYECMKRLDSLGNRAGRHSANYAAVLAAALIQQEAGDVLCCTPEDLGLVALLGTPRKQGDARANEGAFAVNTFVDGKLSALPVVVAAGLKALDTKNAAVLITTAHSAEGWQSTLTQAQNDRLPLVLVVMDRPSSRKKPVPNPLTWPSMSKMAKKLHLPTISVDGEDAVALYRVIQESLHRAKHGDGPAMIWCSFLSDSKATGSSQSIVNMETYLAARGLGPRARKRTPAA